MVVKFTSQTVARDKLTRAVQYGSKLVWYACSQSKVDPELAGRIKRLEITCSTSRKTFRLGKSIDMILGAYKGSKIQDPLIRLCIVIARISRAVYYLYDILNWCCRVTLINGSAKEYAIKAAPFWFIAVFFCLIRDLYEIANYILRAQAKKNDPSIQDCIAQRPDIVVDTLKNMCDLLIPLKIWGKLSINEGKIGMLGLISSICGILCIMNPRYKLSPM